MKKTFIILSLTITPLFLTDIASAQEGISPVKLLERIEAYEKRIEEQEKQLGEMRRELESMKTDPVRLQNPEQVKRVTQQAKEAEEVKEVENEKETGENKFIFRKNKNLALTFSGRLHRMFLVVDDGANTNIFFTDSEQGPTMLRFDATGKVSDDFSIGAAIETGIRQNRPFLISQDKRDAGTDVTVRHAEAILNSSTYGKLYFGRGFAAAWYTPEIDLSATQFANLLAIGMLAPGMKFVNASDNTLSDIQVLTYFVDLERLLLVDRVRYDSPSFGPGLQISGSVANDDRWDFTLRVKPQPFGNWTIVGAGAYLDSPFEGIDRRGDAGVSVLHNPTGLNLTAGGSIERLSVGRNAYSWIVKVGWLADIFSIGKTAFAIDYYNSRDLRLDGDDAKSYGFFAVQKWPEFGVDFYVGHRVYDVNRPDVNLKNLNITVLGGAFNF